MNSLRIHAAFVCERTALLSSQYLLLSVMQAVIQNDGESNDDPADQIHGMIVRLCGNNAQNIRAESVARIEKYEVGSCGQATPMTRCRTDGKSLEAGKQCAEAETDNASRQQEYEG